MNRSDLREPAPFAPRSWISAISTGTKRALRNRSPSARRHLVDDHGADVVTGRGVPVAGIAQTGDEPRIHGLALAALLGSGSVLALGGGRFLALGERHLGGLGAPLRRGAESSASTRSAAGVMTDSTASSGFVRIVTPSGTTTSRTWIMSPMFEVGDVDLDVLGHVLREALDVEVAQVVLDHAALLHADRVADLVRPARRP